MRAAQHHMIQGQWLCQPVVQVLKQGIGDGFACDVFFGPVYQLDGTLQAHGAMAGKVANQAACIGAPNRGGSSQQANMTGLFFRAMYSTISMKVMSPEPIL